MKKVLLIYGGSSTEHEVSCNSAKNIIKNIDKSKYDLTTLKITKDNIWISNDKIVDNIIEYLKQFDVIFPITHGTKGEDGKLQGMLDFFDIKYVGPKTGESFICMDKVYSKMVFEKLGVNVVPYEIYDKNKQINIPFPVIVKPANGGSSVGISKANNEQELNQAIEKANLYDSKIILEQFIKGQELECAVLEDEEIIVSEVGEIKSANEIYDYDSKYINSESQTIIPAHIPNDISNTIKETAEYLFKKMNLKGLSRIDFFYDGNKIYINEINTLPGFNEISMYPKLITNLGISYQELITKLIENAK